MDNASLIAEARACAGQFTLSQPWLTAGSVAAALVTEDGNLYTGICLELACGIGCCAEHSAIAAMLNSRETVIKKIVAVTIVDILAPCGRCRELMVQVDAQNLDAEVILPLGEVRTVRELLPYTWK
ncbi:MAG TPA: cytidine deaminase [Chthonomonadaceae bacterium]|nr:cytidine deaminase [Chthonomonadaceae bacterium]